MTRLEELKARYEQAAAELAKASAWNSTCRDEYQQHVAALELSRLIALGVTPLETILKVKDGRGIWQGRFFVSKVTANPYLNGKAMVYLVPVRVDGTPSKRPAHIRLDYDGYTWEIEHGR